MTQGEGEARREDAPSRRRWPWTPETRPGLPDRVTRLEGDVETLQEHANRLRKSAWAVATAGWLVVIELGLLLLRDGGVG